MSDRPRYMIVQRDELPKAEGLATSLLGRVARRLIWMRPVDNVPEHLAAREWIRFFDEKFEPYGVVRETHVLMPFSADSHGFFVDPQTGVIGSLTRHLKNSAPSFYVLFDDGLMIWMCSHYRIGGARSDDILPKGWIRYPVADTPEESYAYLLRAIEHFASEGRSVVMPTSQQLTDLRAEFYLRRPPSQAIFTAFGVFHALWGAVLTILLMMAL